MSVLINLVLAVVAYLIAVWLLAFVGLDGVIAKLIAIVVAIAVYLQGYSDRFGR